MTIEQLASDKNILAIARTYAGEYADDVIQDALIVMLEMDKDKLEKIQSDGAMLYYMHGVISNLSKQIHKKNQIADSNLMYGLELSHVPEIEADTSLEEKAMDILDILYPEDSKEYPYDRNLFLLYCELGSVRKVQDTTGINYCSVYRTVKEVRDEIRTHLMGYM